MPTGTSRSALALSLATHAGILAFLGWSSFSTTPHAGLGNRPETGVSFSSDDLGGLLDAEPSTAPVPAPEIRPPAPESGFTPPSPSLDLSIDTTSQLEPTAPVISTTAPTPAAMPVLPLAPAKKRSTSPRDARPAPAMERQSGSTTGGAATDTGLAGGARAGGGAGGYVPPQFLLRYKPPYPEQARLQHLEGTVLLLVAVDESGHVTSASLRRTSGHAVLDRAALQAVRTWRFAPARQLGKIVPATVEVPIRFNLKT